MAQIMVLSSISIASASEDQYGIYYRHGRVFGKLIHYDQDRDLGIIYGSVFVKESDGEWRLVESKKFHLVNPTGNDVRETLSSSIGRTAGVEGDLQVWPGQKEEVLAVQSIELSDYQINTPPWFAFGKTIRTEKIFKFNLTSVNDFVNILAGLHNAANLPQDERLSIKHTSDLASRIASPGPGDRQFAYAVRDEFERNWNEKWCVAKDQPATDDLRSGVGGWQFYEGVLGYGNSYVSSAPVIRKDITAFMDAVRQGGGSPEESGPAIMCAYINVKRELGEIVEIKASGVLFDNAPDLLTAFKDKKQLNLQTWKLKGVGEKKVEVMEDNLCWISGERVLVYDPFTGQLIDQYFALDKFLTRNGFENVLDVGKMVIGEGGV